MAKKRMFNLGVLDTDAFMDMPLSAQALYFHLNMRADDDGFIGNPKRIVKIIGANEDDLKLLIVKRFVLAFEDGVIVIKHWRMHNAIRKDRYTQTNFYDDLISLKLKPNGSYTLSGDYPEIKAEKPDVVIDEDDIPDDIQLEADDISDDDHLLQMDDMEPDLDKGIDKEKEKERKAIEMFERMWKLYPFQKKGKGGVSLTKKKYLYSSIGEEQFIRCLERFQLDMAGRDPQFVIQGSTFFNSGYVDYLDDNYKDTMNIIDDAYTENSKQLKRTLQ